jgi:hypothetical protein
VSTLIVLELPQKGDTPMHLCARRGLVKNFAALVAQGGDPSIKNSVSDATKSLEGGWIGLRSLGYLRRLVWLHLCGTQAGLSASAIVSSPCYSLKAVGRVSSDPPTVCDMRAPPAASFRQLMHDTVRNSGSFQVMQTVLRVRCMTRAASGSRPKSAGPGGGRRRHEHPKHRGKPEPDWKPAER